MSTESRCAGVIRERAKCSSEHGQTPLNRRSAVVVVTWFCGPRTVSTQLSFIRISRPERHAYPLSGHPAGTTEKIRRHTTKVKTAVHTGIVSGARALSSGD